MIGRNRIVKVPVVMQMEAVECGAASLTMILAYYGKWLPLEEVREACGVSRDGTSAKHILLAAQKYGLETAAYRMETEDLENGRPCIIHWNFEHFVVFRGIKGNYAYLNDPAIGPVKIPLEEFRQSFTGICLDFEPSDTFVKEGHQTSILSYISRNMRGSTFAFWITLTFAFLAAAVALTTPLFSKVFLDEILSGRNARWATIFLVAMGMLALFNFLLVLFRERYTRRIEGQLALNGNMSYLRHLFRLPMNFFAMRHVGDLQQRQHLNETITHALVIILAPQIINLALLILYLLLMVYYSPTLTLIGIAAAIINLGFVRYFANLRLNLNRSMQQSIGKYYSATVSCIDNMESIKAAGAETGFFNFWSGLWAHKFNIGRNAQIQQTYMSLLPVITMSLVNTLVLILGALYILQGKMTIGMLMAFQGFMTAFLSPVNEIVKASQQILEMRSQMERVEDVMKYPEDQRYVTGSAPQGKLSGALELRDVCFGYSPVQPPLIEHFNLRIEPGHSVAFVGSSGCGKSTLAKLISGLYQPWSGEILFDGRPIETIGSDELTNSVAVIDQNVVLFDDTVAQNIRMWDQSIEEFTMMLACNDAQIRTDIISRPEGFGTKLINGGQNFSGGQRQRMEIATALAKEPTIIIMDEATSALDPTTEDHVMASIRAMGVSQIIIAHRLSTIRDCDEIIVMDKGKILQRGTHQQLISQEGRYKELMENQ